jgi:hypothetical protein
MMMFRFVFVVCILLQIGCSGVRAPKDRLVRKATTYETDLIELQEYIGSTPVDVVVEGYKPEMTADIPVVYSHDSLEATIKQAVILQISPVNTYLRPRGGPVTSYIRVPTNNVVRIAVDGFRPQQESSAGSGWWLLPIFTGAFAIIAAFIYKQVFVKDGWTGCFFVVLGILAAAVCVISTVTILLTQKSVAPGTLERISKYWIFQ